ncbi:MAG: FHA domain-containing protein [Actinomycetota bacterium]
MPELALTILKYAFLSLIFLFLARAVRAMFLDISGRPAPGGSTQAMAPPAARSAKPPDHVALLAPDGGKPQIFSLDEELILGRAGKCHVVLSDAYASQVHARIFRRNGGYFVEDMGSTNGTYLNRKRVTSPTAVSRGDRIRIGKTELEFRR